MGMLLAFIGLTVFLAALWQWASGGASLWRIFSLRRDEKSMSREQKQDAERELKMLEQSADRSISSSLKISAWLAVIVWLFLGITMILDMFGINWVSALYSRAKSYWVAPGTQSQQSTQTRNDTLRNMGNSFRR